jgi:hypothetical protein
LGQWDITDEDPEYGDPILSLRIVDAAGSTWVRDEAGTLTRLDERASTSLRALLVKRSQFVEWTYLD